MPSSATAVILVSLWLRLPLRDWAVLILTITVVWIAEFINTALEAVVDLASPQQHPLAKVGKDVGAAAVLLAALGLRPDWPAHPRPPALVKTAIPLRQVAQLKISFPLCSFVPLVVKSFYVLRITFYPLPDPMER